MSRNKTNESDLQPAAKKRPFYAIIMFVCLGLVLCVCYVFPFVKMRTFSPQPVWPSLPKTASSARQLIARFSTPGLPKTVVGAPTAEKLLALIDKQAANNQLRAGWPQIMITLQRSLPPNKQAFLLWGIYHDANLQLAAFLRLLGAGGLEQVTDVIVEPFHANGYWKGIPLSEQYGDNVLLQDVIKRASSRSLFRFRVNQTRDNYTGWKYHQLHMFGDLLLLVKARGRKVFGCDMPARLQRRISFRGDEVLRLRELHCVLGNSLLSTKPRQTVVFWGQAHIGSDGFPRFLPPSAMVTSVYVFGGRSARAVVENKLQKRLALTVPILVKLKSAGRLKRYALVLPGHLLGTSSTQAGMQTTQRPAYRLHVSGDFERFHINSRVYTKSANIRLPAGDYAFRVKYKGQTRSVVGGVRVMKQGFVNIVLYDSVHIEYHYDKLPIDTPSR
jgi:hypothetical protein